MKARYLASTLVVLLAAAAISLLAAFPREATSKRVEGHRPLVSVEDPRDEQALRDWERIGGDPAAFFLHHYPAPVDESGAYRMTEEDRKLAIEDDAEQRRIGNGK